MTLAIQSLITNRCRELGLGHGELVRRCGYKNISKGMRRLGQLYAGDLQKGQALLRVLPIVLEVSPDIVKRAVEETRRQLSEAETRVAVEKEAAWRAAFKPHAIILTERSRPEPIFVAAFFGIDRLLRVDFDLSAGRASFVNQALNGIRGKLSLCSDEIPAFGRPIGVVVNYAPNRAVRFDLEGYALEILPKAYRPGEALLFIGRQQIPPGMLHAFGSEG
jgi:hypothetical protein